MLQRSGPQARAESAVGGGAQRWAKGIGLAVAVGIAYFLAAQLGLALLTATERVAVFWPASGIAAGVLIALGRWARVPAAVAVIGASAAAALMSDRNIWSALAFGLCNAGEALLVAWLIERWFGPAFSLDSLRRVLGLFAATAVATATAAAGAAGAMKLFGPSTAAFLGVWKVWFASDALGMLTVAPLLIGITAAVRDAPSWRELLEGTLVVVIVAVANGFALTQLSGPWSLIAPATFLFPLLLWLGYRCQPAFAAAAVFAIAAAVVWTTIHGLGRYGDPAQPIAMRVLAAQVAMLGATLAALALAALFAERRRHEASIVGSEARLRSILDAANVIAWDLDLIRNTVHSAGPVARLLDRPVPVDFAAMVETIHPDDRDSVMAQFWTAVSTAAAYRLEFRLNLSDGVRWLTVEGAIERDAHGRPKRVRGITHDITERKKTELALAERDARLALVEKTALVGSYAFDTATAGVQLSPGCAAIHGFPEGTSEIRRDDWRAGVQPDDLARYDMLLSQAFAERQHEYHMEYRILRSGGEVRWIEARAFILYDRDGRAERVVGINIDITQRKRVEAALEESDARYRALYHDNPSMYFTVNAAGTVLSVNEFGARQLGYAPAELVGQSVLQLIHEKEREVARRRLASYAEKPETITRTELRKVRRDGSILWVSEVVRAVREPGGRTVLLVVCEDITDLKRAEEHQNLLIAELDHRVKNVLANVVVVARRTGERSSSMAEFIEALDHRLQSMADAHALLSRSRWQGVSLADLVGHELAPYPDNAIVEGPHVRLTAATTHAMAMVLHELATNAAKYGALSTPQGRVSVQWDWRSNGGVPATLRLEWHEQGGPAITVPAHAGYGTSVIRDLIPYELGGTVEFEFAPDGVRCAVVIPGEQARHGDRAANSGMELASVR